MNNKNKTYNFEIDRKQVSVTSDEVREYYKGSPAITDEDIENNAAWYTARIKLWKECNIVLNKELVQRLIDEQKLMKEGESDSFKLQLYYTWYVIIEKETTEHFSHIVYAYCLDNAQTFTRRYTGLEKTILHCLNEFNENANICNKYQSIDEFLANPNNNG